MNNKTIILEVKKILKEDTDKYLYRNLGVLSNKLKVSKTRILRAVTKCKEIEIIFNEENYNPNSGPLFALRECIKSKAKESRICIEQEKEKEKKEKEKEAEKKKEKKTPYKKPKQASDVINKRRIKNCTKKFIRIHKDLDEVLNQYSISLSKNDEELMSRAVNLMGDFTGLIKDMIDKNKFTKYELEDNKK